MRSVKRVQVRGFLHQPGLDRARSKTERRKGRVRRYSSSINHLLSWIITRATPASIATSRVNENESARPLFCPGTRPRSRPEDPRPLGPLSARGSTHHDAPEGQAGPRAVPGALEHPPALPRARARSRAALPLSLDSVEAGPSPWRWVCTRDSGTRRVAHRTPASPVSCSRSHA